MASETARRDRSLVSQSPNVDVDESCVVQRLPPPANTGGMLAPPTAVAEEVLEQSGHPRRPAAEHLPRETGDHGSVARLPEPDLEHHVAGYEAPARTQHPDCLGQGTALVGVSEVVKAIVGEDYVDRRVAERELGRVAGKHVNIVDRAGHEFVLEMAAHRAGNVQGRHVRHVARRCKRQQPRSSADVEYAVAVVQIGEQDDLGAQVPKAWAVGELFHVADMTVPRLGSPGIESPPPARSAPSRVSWPTGAVGGVRVSDLPVLTSPAALLRHGT